MGKIFDALNKHSKELSAPQPQKVTAGDRKALLTYDRKTGHLVKYNEKTGQVDHRSMDVLKNRGTLQRLLDNQLIFPGGQLTPMGLQMVERLEKQDPTPRPAEKAAAPDVPLKTVTNAPKTPATMKKMVSRTTPQTEKALDAEPLRENDPSQPPTVKDQQTPQPDVREETRPVPPDPEKKAAQPPIQPETAGAEVIELDAVVERKNAPHQPGASAPPETLAAPGPAVTPGMPIYRPADVDKNLISLLQPQSYEAEQFKILRTNILYPRTGKAPRSMLVTSSLPGEGKSFVAANLAVSIALNINKHVLLIDCDLRKPDLHRRFGFQDAPGLSNYLAEHKPLENLLLKTEVNKLTILPGGPPPDNPSELMSSERMAALIEEVQNRYHDRLIVIDSPPPALTAETGVLARLVDGIILVVRYGKTPRDRVADLIDNVGSDKIIGSVINYVDTGASKYYGYKKYGPYGYGKKDKKQKK